MITVRTDELKKAMTNIAKVASPNVRLVAEEKYLWMYAADLETYPVLKILGKIVSPFEAVVNAKLLSDLVKSHISEETRIDIVKEGLRVRGVSGTLILDIEKEEVPYLPIDRWSGETLEITGKQLSNIYKRCAPFVNKDAMEYNNNGIMLHRSGLAVATNGKCISISDAVIPTEGWKGVILKKTLDITEKLFKKSSQVNVLYGDDRILFHDPETGNSVYGRILVGEFPPWESIDVEYTSSIQFEYAKFRSAVEQANTCTKDDEKPCFGLLVGCGERVEITTNSGLFATMPFIGAEVLEATQYHFNPVQVLTWLKTMGKGVGNITFCLTKPDQSAKFNAPEQGLIIQPLC